MRSIERRFKNTEKRYPELSSFICFCKTIKGQKFSANMVHRWFYKLVDKNDYSSREKRELFKHLENLTIADK